MPNKIYIVAGERNMKLAQIEGGLWANVGQTTRDVSDRLRDDDYKRKAAGGKWQVLLNQGVGESLSDHQVHPFLKQHPEVSWDRESDNTEEFFFKGDPGDGSVARRIVSEILRRICVPLLQEENSKLHEEADRLRAELEQANSVIRDLSSDELISAKLAKIKELEVHNGTLVEQHARIFAGVLDALADEKEALQSEVERSRKAERMMKERLDTLHAEANRRRQPQSESTQPQSESTPMWLWAIPLALLSYCGGCTRAENKWEDTLSREQLAEKHHYLASWSEDASPEKVESVLISQWKYASDLVEQNSRLKTKIQELTAEKDKVKSVPHDPSITAKVPPPNPRPRPPQRGRVAAQVKGGPIETVSALSSCTALNYAVPGEIQCETADSIIRVKGAGISQCEGRKISFKTVGGSIIASCNGIYGSHRGTVTITP